MKAARSHVENAVPVLTGLAAFEKNGVKDPALIAAGTESDLRMYRQMAKQKELSLSAIDR